GAHLRTTGRPKNRFRRGTGLRPGPPRGRTQEASLLVSPRREDGLAVAAQRREICPSRMDNHWSGGTTVGRSPEPQDAVLQGDERPVVGSNRHRHARVLDDTPKRLMDVAFPEPHTAIGARGPYGRAVEAEARGADRAGVVQGKADRLADDRVPEPRRAVHGSREE